jgi:hypothetical protein
MHICLRAGLLPCPRPVCTLQVREFLRDLRRKAELDTQVQEWRAMEDRKRRDRRWALRHGHATAEAKGELDTLSGSPSLAPDWQPGTGAGAGAGAGLAAPATVGPGAAPAVAAGPGVSSVGGAAEAQAAPTIAPDDAAIGMDGAATPEQGAHSCACPCLLG